MTTLRRIFTGTALAVMACGVASADSLIQTFTLNNTNTDIVGAIGTGTFNDFLTQCPACSASWLSGVKISIAVNENLNALTVTNTASNPNNFEYETYSNLTIVGTAPTADKTTAGFLLFSNRTPFTAGPGGCAAGTTPGDINLCDTASLSYNIGETKTFAPPPVTAGNATGVYNASSIAPYDDFGTFTLGFTTTTFQSFVGGGGNGADTQATQANGVITVEYDYVIPSSTPEPATMALMGGALLGLGLLGKRVKKQ